MEKRYTLDGGKLIHLSNTFRLFPLACGEESILEAKSFWVKEWLLLSEAEKPLVKAYMTFLDAILAERNS